MPTMLQKMRAEHTLRMLGDNVTLATHAWLELLDELRADSELAGRIRAMLAEADSLPVILGASNPWVSRHV